MPVAADLRLPGVYFLPSPRPAALGLPPLDVAAFVGFAERGPLHLPVPVEDVQVYQAIFGGDLAVAHAGNENLVQPFGSPPQLAPTREENGQVIYANLPKSVEAFFANGGRRCYVVRVAGSQSSSTHFRVPGIVAFGASDQAGHGPGVFAIAASKKGKIRPRIDAEANVAKYLGLRR